MFKVPVENVNNRSVCNLSSSSQRADWLREASLFIWDESPMTYKYIIQKVDRTLRHFTGRDQEFFEGKNIIFAGDIRQISPVVKHGSSEDVIRSSIRFSYVWSMLETVSLTV